MRYLFIQEQNPSNKFEEIARRDAEIEIRRISRQAALVQVAKIHRIYLKKLSEDEKRAFREEYTSEIDQQEQLIVANYDILRIEDPKMFGQSPPERHDLIGKYCGYLVEGQKRWKEVGFTYYWGLEKASKWHRHALMNIYVPKCFLEEDLVDFDDHGEALNSVTDIQEVIGLDGIADPSRYAAAVEYIVKYLGKEYDNPTLAAVRKIYSNSRNLNFDSRGDQKYRRIKRHDQSWEPTGTLQFDSLEEYQNFRPAALIPNQCHELQLTILELEFEYKQRKVAASDIPKDQRRAYHQEVDAWLDEQRLSIISNVIRQRFALQQGDYSAIDETLPVLAAIPQGRESFKPVIQKVLEAWKQGRPALVTGGGGTGKSSLIQALVLAMKIPEDEYICLSATGKAVVQLLSKGLKANTIHGACQSDMSQHFKRSPANCLPYKYVFFDEISMIGMHLLAKVLIALRDDCLIYYTGDYQQLEPVKDISTEELLTELCENIELTEQHRQDEGFNPMDIQVEEKQLDNLEELVSEASRKGLMILCDTKRLTRMVNDLVSEKLIAGVPVMITKKDARKGTYNGLLGKFKGMDGYNYVIELEGGQIVRYSEVQRTHFAIAHAITVHKSQGSEWDHGLVLLDGRIKHTNPKLEYTARTRWRKSFEIYKIVKELSPETVILDEIEHLQLLHELPGKQIA